MRIKRQIAFEPEVWETLLDKRRKEGISISAWVNLVIKRELGGLGEI